MIAYIERAKEQALHDFQHAELLWQIRAAASRKPGDKPELPKILRRRPRA